MQKIKVLLCSTDKSAFMHNTKHMFFYLKDNEKYELKYVINEDKKRKKLTNQFGNKFISIKTKAGKKYMLNADVWLLDGGMPTKNILYMRNKIIINLWHGGPPKIDGWRAYSGLNKVRMFFQLKLFSLFVTAFITTSREFIDLMADSFLLSKEKIKVFGQPRNDQLKSTVSRNVIFNSFNDINENAKFVLYAPTWRQSKYGKPYSKELIYFPFDNFDYIHFNKFLITQNIVFFVRAHPLEKNKIKEYSNIKILDTSVVENINDILNVFDLLISDYSSIYADYLLTKKPIILLPYDLEEFEQYFGLCFPFDNTNPGPNIKDLDDFKYNLERLLHDKNYFLERREKLNTFFNEVEDNSCQRIKDFIEEKICIT